MSRMESKVLCESAGWVLFADGRRLVFADRGTSYRRVLVFVLALLAVIAGANGTFWLVAGIRAGETSRLGIVRAAVALPSAFAASRVWAAEKRDHRVVPGEETWVAVLDLESQMLETPEGDSLAPLSSVRFVPVMQFGSSSRALSASWPGGSMVVYRGSPFAGSFHEALDALRRSGVDPG